ncbi:MAG: DEAD/DEAH box helicase family protein [Thermotogota bacterium]|nr:DEAD/DEAH box helicase family protein [Thermotogota bacterium]
MGNVTLKFKHQPFQQETAQSVVNCFKGQPCMNNPLNPGNFSVQLSGSAVLENIQSVQRTNNLPVSFALDGQYNLSIEMETGTGKTYTYIKTMYELNWTYGWKKFIVVVPSVAIREGVFKSFQMTKDHFFNQYHKRIRYFIYDSNQLSQIKGFATDPTMHSMIINSQAFNVHDKGLRIIHSTPDQFNSDCPMRAIAATRPILIIDEPQSVEGDQTKKALQAFDAPIVLRYSATLKKDFNKIYELKKDGEPAFSLDYDQASELHHWLFLNGYIDECNYLTEDFYYDLLDDCVVLPYLLAGYEREFLKEMEKAYKRQTVAICDNALENAVIVADPNGRFKHREFQAIWNIIRQKTIYRVRFHSLRLIYHSIQKMNDQLNVTQPSFHISSGAFSSFNPVLSSGPMSSSTLTKSVAPSSPSHTRYDLIGDIARQTLLKRETVVAILQGMDPRQFDLFKVNPNEFIMNCSTLINQVKWELMQKKIRYATTTVMYDDQIFSQSIRKGYLGQNAVKTKKQVYDYLIYDSSVEHRFAQDLDASDQVEVYAKLPPGFLIPTPVGNYNPDWAIVMKGEKGQWLYLVVETKSTKEERARRVTENDKIDCAVKHFEALNYRKKTNRVAYHVVDSFETLLNELQQSKDNKQKTKTGK